MKPIKYIMAGLLCLLLLTACGGENIQTADDLPQNQQEEIEQSEPEKEEPQAPEDFEWIGGEADDPEDLCLYGCVIV